MKRIILSGMLCILCLTNYAQVSDIQVRFGGDLWNMNYVASAKQINCGLCPQIIGVNPEAESLINALQDTVMQEKYVHGGLNLSISASVLWPILRAELQIASSMRKLNLSDVQVSNYVNRNISALIGITPMKNNARAGKYLLGRSHQNAMVLDMSDAGVYAQFSFDAGFEEFVRSTQNMALVARWQPVIWANRRQQIGLSFKAGAKMWLLGNRSVDGPFTDSSGLPKKVKPAPTWFIGMAFIAAPFANQRR